MKICTSLQTNNSESSEITKLGIAGTSELQLQPLLFLQLPVSVQLARFSTATQG